MRHVLAVCGALFLASAAQAQTTSVAFGNMQQDTSLPVEVTSQELSVDQETGIAIFTGDVVIVQGEMRLAAPRVMVVYSEDQRRIQRLEATGGATLVSGEDAAEAERADYDIDTGLVVMTNDVLVTRGLNVMTSDYMTVDLTTGSAQMHGRVKTILQPQE
ncbi:lipopolysaccharide transport periplasmic protein LptA [Lutimaribacter pacificus]|uniref:lipopolysaccharide transport periplasmic protein LptA n=1 Tax=Lutimaribacter pacificus TaxID=391948 RepID=UPI001CB838FB|nr:lipopolysaccharide transport periplasmic protein LptA [Lutimaribacter pacificus]